jgi:hypothetical protein
MQVQCLVMISFTTLITCFFGNKGKWISLGILAHDCNNPNYWEGRDWEGGASKSAQTESSQDPPSPPIQAGNGGMSIIPAMKGAWIGGSWSRLAWA